MVLFVSLKTLFVSSYVLPVKFSILFLFNTDALNCAAVPLQLVVCHSLTAPRSVHTALVLKMTPVGVETLASFTADFAYYFFIAHL